MLWLWWHRIQRNKRPRKFIRWNWWRQLYINKKTKSAFNGNYIEYQSKGDKDKNLCPKEYLDMIRPYLSDMIIDYKTQGERKIQ